MGEIGFGQVRTLLEDNDAEPVGGKLFGQDTPSGARTDNDKVHFVGGLVFGLVYVHFFSASFMSAFAATSQPG